MANFVGGSNHEERGLFQASDTFVQRCSAVVFGLLAGEVGEKRSAPVQQQTDVERDVVCFSTKLLELLPRFEALLQM